MKRLLSIILTLLLFCSVVITAPTVGATAYVADSEIRVTVSTPEFSIVNGIVGEVTYGSSLQLVDDSASTPYISDSYINTAESGKIYFNATNASSTYTLTDNVLFVADFILLEDVDAIDFECVLEDAFIIENVDFVDLSLDVEVSVEVISTPEEPLPDVTVKIAAPIAENTYQSWDSVQMFYNSTTSITGATFIDMTATDEVFYAGSVGSCAYIKAGEWTIFETTLSSEQQEAINDATAVGFCKTGGSQYTRMSVNVLRYGIDEEVTNGEKQDVATFDNHIFVITDLAGTNTSSCTMYTGYWVSDYIDVMAAAPQSDTSYYNWDGMEIYYSDETSFDHSTVNTIPMVETSLKTKVETVGNTSDTIKTGRWPIYKVSINAKQIEAIDASSFVGFKKAGENNNRTNYRTYLNVLMAPVDEYTDHNDYASTTTSIREFEEMVFVIQGRTASITSVMTYVGMWQTADVYNQGKDDTITIYFAAPIGTTSSRTWDNVQFVYGDSSAYTSTTKIDMTKTEKTYTVESVEGLTTLQTGEWTIYSLELTAEQMAEIDNSKYCGFKKTDSYVRTRHSTIGNVRRASLTEFENPYPYKYASIEAMDGKLFVIQGYYQSGYEADSYMGSWVALEE